MGQCVLARGMERGAFRNDLLIYSWRIVFPLTVNSADLTSGTTP